MTQLFKLVRGASEVDFLGSTFKLVDGSWSTRAAEGGNWETFQVIIPSSVTQANTRTAIKGLTTMLKQARDYINNTVNSVPTYITFASEGETSKSAVVVDSEVEVVGDTFNSPFLLYNGTLLNIAVERLGWQNLTATSATAGGLSTLGGTYIMAAGATHDLGDADQRIGIMKITSSDAVALLTRVWMGVRDMRGGSTGFISLWECEDGTNGTDATDVAMSGTHATPASDDAVVQVDFTSSAALLKRFSIKWSQVQTSGNYDDIIGEYLVLCRLQLDAETTEVRVQLRHGWGGSTLGAEIVGDTYLSGVDDTSLDTFQLIELGRVKIPPTGNRDGAYDTNIKDYTIEIWAERISASGTIDFDCLVLVPAEHLAYMDKCLINAGDGAYADLYTGLDGTQWADTRTATAGVIGQVEYLFENFYFPSGGGILVVAAEATGSHVLSETVDLEFSLYPNWQVYRV